jgi:hypothetical protein
LRAGVDRFERCGDVARRSSTSHAWSSEKPLITRLGDAMHTLVA